MRGVVTAASTKCANPAPARDAAASERTGLKPERAQVARLKRLLRLAWATASSQLGPLRLGLGCLNRLVLAAG